MRETIVTHEVTKRYGRTIAVDGVDLEIHRGEVFALLGPNGAGKTTLIEILEGHRRADSGTVNVLGYDPHEAPRAFRERIGIVLQDSSFDEEFSVLELITLYRGMYPRRFDADALIDQVGLTGKRRARVKTLSGGQRRRLDLALGLVGDPDLLFLDEPTTGFDPSARHRAWDLVEMLRNSGKTVLLTTHYMDEVEHLADRVGVMVRGRLTHVGTPAELAALRSNSIITFTLPPGTRIHDIPTLDSRPEQDGAGWRLETGQLTEQLHALTGWAMDHRVDLPSLQVRQPSLEDVYLSLIGDDAHPDTARVEETTP